MASNECLQEIQKSKLTPTPELQTIFKKESEVEERHISLKTKLEFIKGPEDETARVAPALDLPQYQGVLEDIDCICVSLVLFFQEVPASR